MGIPLDPNKKYVKRDIWTQHTWNPLDHSSPYIEDGKILRDIKPVQNGLYGAVHTGLTQKYAEEGWIPNHTFHKEEGRVEMERIPWVAFAENYCLWQRRDLLIHSLLFAKRLEQDNLYLVDLSIGQCGAQLCRAGESNQATC